MARAKKTPARGNAGARASRLLGEKVLDVLESLLEADDEKVRLAAAKEIKEIVRQAGPEDRMEQGRQDAPARVFVVTGIDRKPG